MREIPEEEELEDDSPLKKAQKFENQTQADETTQMQQMSHLPEDIFHQGLSIQNQNVTDIQHFETPSAQLIEDCRNALDLDDDQMESILNIAEAYDKLRQAFINNLGFQDSPIADYFQNVVNSCISVQGKDRYAALSQ